MKLQRMETFSPVQRSWRGTRWDAKYTFSPDSDLCWWLSSTESACQCKRRRFDPWVEKIPGEGNGNPKEISWMEEPGGLQSMGSQRVGHNGAIKQPDSKQEFFSPYPSVSQAAWGSFQRTWCYFNLILILDQHTEDKEQLRRNHILANRTVQNTCASVYDFKKPYESHIIW